MLEYVSKIMEKIGKMSNYTNLNKMLNLRKNNKIRSIHSSLAIESNSLTLEQVTAVIDGKLIMGPQKEIQEVLNAYSAYEMIGKVNPFSFITFELFLSKVVTSILRNLYRRYFK